MSLKYHFLIEADFRLNVFCKLILVLLPMVFMQHDLSATVNTDIKRLSGVVITHADSTLISNVHVINLTRVKGISTADDGSFAISMMQGDSIMFQAIGFISDTIFVTEQFFNETDHITVKLEKKIYLLPGIDIFPYATYAEFKQAFINFDDNKLMDTVYEISLELPQLLFIPPTSQGAGVTLTGPITLLYDQFSRRGREKRKYSEIKQEEERFELMYRRVNPEVVRKLTGLEDEKEINDFLDFCNLSYEFIVNSKEYQVYQAILNYYRRYKFQRQ